VTPEYNNSHAGRVQERDRLAVAPAADIARVFGGRPSR
jgi:hypothetical protein